MISVDRLFQTAGRLKFLGQAADPLQRDDDGRSAVWKKKCFFCRRVSTTTHRTALDFARESGSLEVVEALKRYSQPQAWGLVDMYHLPPFKRSFKIFKLNWFLQRLANSERCVRPCILSRTFDSSLLAKVAVVGVLLDDATFD